MKNHIQSNSCLCLELLLFIALTVILHLRIISYAGKKENIEMIKKIGCRYKSLEIEEALYELNARMCNNS